MLTWAQQAGRTGHPTGLLARRTQVPQLGCEARAARVPSPASGLSFPIVAHGWTVPEALSCCVLGRADGPPGPSASPDSDHLPLSHTATLWPDMCPMHTLTRSLAAWCQLASSSRSAPAWASRSSSRDSSRCRSWFSSRTLAEAAGGSRTPASAQGQPGSPQHPPQHSTLSPMAGP